MGRALLVLWNDAMKAKAIDWIRRAPRDTRVEFKGPQRSIPQNDRQWAMLTDIATQLCWHGQFYPPQAWKDYFMHSYRGATWMPHEDGGMVPVGMHTSDLSVQEHSEFTMLVEAFAARHGVKFRETVE